MIYDIIGLILSLAVILYSCELFTNGIEWLGKKLNFSQGVVGSILAAVGTALPETMIPIIAILFGTGANSHDVGIGAILGAPFMLATLAFFVTGLAVIIYTLLKKRTTDMKVNTEVISRDLGFFLVAYGIAVGMAFVPSHKLSLIRILAAVVLLGIYIIYVYKTFKDKQEESVGKLDELTFSKFFKIKNNLNLIIIQVVVALIGIIAGAKFFVDNMVGVAVELHISALILSLILTPIATELPEKFNSIIWIGKGKDTLALGNITGAMIFQSCFPVAFGVVFTDWALQGVTLVCALIALFSGAINYLYLKVRHTLNPYMLLLGGAFYAVFLGYIFL